MKKEIICSDCGHSFFVSASKIKQYKKMGYYIPSHCPACRDIRWKEERTQNRRVKKYERKKYE